MKFDLKLMHRQKGLTLLETLAALFIGALLMYSVLSLAGIGKSSSDGQALVSDVTGIRDATQGLFAGQGNYGTNPLNSMLVTFKNKIPTDVSINGSTLQTSNGGLITVTGNGTSFTLTLTGQPSDMCGTLLTSLANGWASVQVGSGTPITTFPVSPEVAALPANCGGNEPFTLTWTSID